MSHKVSLVIALLILAALGAGYWVHGWEMFVFFGKLLDRAVNYLAFWR